MAAGVALVGLAAGFYFVLAGFGDEVRRFPAVDLLMVFGLFVLPQLTAFPVKFLQPGSAKLHHPARDQFLLVLYLRCRRNRDHLRAAGGCVDRDRPALGSAAVRHLRGHLLQHLHYAVHDLLHQWLGHGHRHHRLAGLLAGAARRAARQPALVLLSADQPADV